MASTRLPDKILKKFCDGKPMLQVLIERPRASHFIDEIVVATTINHTDDPIVSLCENLGASYYRGSEDNVLSRLVSAAIMFDPAAVPDSAKAPHLPDISVPGTVKTALNQARQAAGARPLTTVIFTATKPRSMPDSLAATIMKEMLPWPSR